VIQKLRFNERLTTADLDALEQMLIKAGAGTPDDLSKVRSSNGLGLFVRSMVGLNREAAKRAFDGFLAGKTLTANQIHFTNLVIDYPEWQHVGYPGCRAAFRRHARLCLPQSRRRTACVHQLRKGGGAIQ
jgi:type I site-specific restriction endonuclease